MRRRARGHYYVSVRELSPHKGIAGPLRSLSQWFQAEDACLAPPALRRDIASIMWLINIIRRAGAGDSSNSLSDEMHDFCSALHLPALMR